MTAVTICGNIPDMKSTSEGGTMQGTDRIKVHTQRAADAVKALKTAKTVEDKLAAAKALESAACQLRRALKGA